MQWSNKTGMFAGNIPGTVGVVEDCHGGVLSNHVMDLQPLLIARVNDAKGLLIVQLITVTHWALTVLALRFRCVCIAPGRIV